MTEPDSDIADSESIPPRLRVRKDLPAGIGPVKACPSCNSTVAENALICVRCGFNFQTGSHLSTSSGMGRKLAIGGAVLVSVLVAVAAIVYLINQFQHDAPQPPPQTITELPPTPALPAPPEVVITDLPDAMDKQAELEIRAAAAQAEQEARLSVERDQLRAQLEERFPAINIGESVALRMANGFVHRGRYLGMRDGIAVVSEGGERTRLPIAELDRESRLRVDPEARELLVEQRLQQTQGAPSP